MTSLVVPLGCWQFCLQVPYCLRVVLSFWGGARWLKTATWPGLTVHDGLNWLAGYVPKAEFMTPYLGLNKIISAVLGSPLPFGLAAMGIAWFTLAFFLFSLIPIDDKFKHKR